MQPRLRLSIGACIGFVLLVLACVLWIGAPAFLGGEGPRIKVLKIVLLGDDFDIRPDVRFADAIPRLMLRSARLIAGFVFALLYKTKVVDAIPVIQAKVRPGHDSPYGRRRGNADFTPDLFDCCRMRNTCFHVFFCGSCRVGHTMQVAGVCDYWPTVLLWFFLARCCGPCFAFYFRSKLRQKLGLAPDFCTDCLAYSLCGPCAVGQDALHVDMESGVTTKCCCQLAMDRQEAPPVQANILGQLTGHLRQPTVDPTAGVSAATDFPVSPGSQTVFIDPGGLAALALEEEMRHEVNSHNLIGPRISLDVLKEQYVANPSFLQKIDGLENKYGQMRRIRPDGNCFYRAYLFCICEQLASDSERHANFMALAQESLDFCTQSGYERFEIEHIFHRCLDCLKLFRPDLEPAPSIVATFEECDDYLICWARILTSAYLRRHHLEYAAFLTSHATIADFCAAEVEPISTEADHLQITALSSHLAIPISVAYLDRSGGDTAVEHQFQTGEVAGEQQPSVHLLYRPGHYDIIYPR